MINIDNIQDIHSKYNTLAAEADLCTDRNMNDLMMFAIDSDHMDFDGDHLVLTHGAGPLKKVEIERIVGAEDFGSHMAIVLPASVILVNKKNGEVSVYLPD